MKPRQFIYATSIFLMTLAIGLKATAQKNPVNSSQKIKSIVDNYWVSVCPVKSPAGNAE